MTNNRVIPLLAVAFVATLTFIEQTHCADDDSEKFAKLIKPGLSSRNVGKLLKTIDQPGEFKIGKLTVWEIRKEFDNANLNILDCQEATLARRQEYVEDLKSVPSIHKYAKGRFGELLKFCNENFKQVMKGNQQLKELGVKGLEITTIARILGLIEDQDYVRIGEVSIRAILNLAAIGDMSIDHCQREQILKYLKGNGDSRLNMVLNVYKFLLARSTEQLMSQCLHNVKQVFRDNQLIDKLDDDSLTIEEVKNLLSSIGDKDNVKFGPFSVRTMLDLDSGESLSVKDCLHKAVFEGRYYRNIGVGKFMEALYKRLVPFCLLHMNEILDMSVGKEILKSNKSPEFSSIEESEAIRDICPRVIRSFELLVSIRHGAPRSLENVPLTHWIENDWAVIHQVCLIYRKYWQGVN